MKKIFDYPVLTIAIILSLGIVVAKAQGQIPGKFWIGHRDHPTPPPPCYLMGSSQAVVYEGRWFIIYTCNDQRTIVREFTATADLDTHMFVYPERGR